MKNVNEIVKLLEECVDSLEKAECDGVAETAADFIIILLEVLDLNDIPLGLQKRMSKVAFNRYMKMLFD